MKTTLQDAKAIVLAHYDRIAQATPETVADALATHTSADWHWRGLHPFHEQTGAHAVAKAYWVPFLTSMKSVQRRQDVFFAGRNTGEDDIWVSSMGHMLALFDAPFLGIRATRKIVMYRYAEFNRVVGDKIVETACFFDLLHLMSQAGVNPMPPQTGMHLVQPGPATHDGLLFDEQDVQIGRDTMQLINRMIGDIDANSNDKDTPRDATPQEELQRCWHDDMLWWGPEGVGATYTIDRYIQQHQQPFRRQLGNRQFNGHIARISEGTYGGFFGWPNLTLTPLGGYMGMPGNGTVRADMRVVDIYRRDGDKLAENWIFIDVLHFLNQQGLDVLARLEQT
jgi:hypothetical protein